MKTTVVVLAVLLFLVGLVWMGQGLGFVKGSFMTDKLVWFWIGLACVIGSGVLVGVRRGLR
jgi:hypothetical protein